MDITGPASRSASQPLPRGLRRRRIMNVGWPKLGHRFAVAHDNDRLTLDHLVDQAGQALFRFGDAIGAHDGPPEFWLDAIAVFSGTFHGSVQTACHLGPTRRRTTLRIDTTNPSRNPHGPAAGHRPRPALHRLGPHRGGRQPAAPPRRRRDRHRRRDLGARPAAGAARRARRAAGRVAAGRGGDRGDLCQPQRQRDLEARLCPRRGAAGAGTGRRAGHRIRRQVGEAGGGRHRRGGQDAGADDGAAAAARRGDRRADAADALAVAICHAHHRASRRAWAAVAAASA